jgi:hypothetical protein
MNPTQLDPPGLLNPEAQLEMSLIEEYLREQGYSLAALHSLPPEEAKRLMTEASRYASAKMTMVETRARFVHEVHGVAPPLT